MKSARKIGRSRRVYIKVVSKETTTGWRNGSQTTMEERLDELSPKWLQQQTKPEGKKAQTEKWKSINEAQSSQELRTQARSRNRNLETRDLHKDSMQTRQLNRENRQATQRSRKIAPWIEKRKWRKYREDHKFNKSDMYSWSWPVNTLFNERRNEGNQLPYIFTAALVSSSAWLGHRRPTVDP